jgi:uncharacterized protein
MSSENIHTNDLIRESSPYLLQHANNPVNWVPWSKTIFKQAEKKNKLVLVSIGYAACHWCHVMEKECFEDEDVAKFMNENFICVKVDREERPDVDQVYMIAVQLMTQKGGWPLNCFTLPNGLPIYGGTYFPKEQWIEVLKNLKNIYTTKPTQVVDYANKLKEGIQQSEHILILKPVQHFSIEKIHEMVLRWSHQFDHRDGGTSRAPKFPLPSNYDFLLRYASYEENPKILNHVLLTIDKMALGGIYDQIGGGFARYSVDMLWKIPHFEKMLYDNAQLISLYSQAYRKTKNSFYKRIVNQTVSWLEREMQSPEGGFYSAIDADSEGEEGKFYVWKKVELKQILGSDYDWVSEFYCVNEKGFWEDEKYILLRDISDEFWTKKMAWSESELEKKITIINDKLLSERNKRIKPAIDDKCLTSWNSMLIKGLIDAYFAFDDDTFLYLALKIGKWIAKYQLSEGKSLMRNFCQGKSTIKGFLEDYAHTISAFIHLFQATFDKQWLDLAENLTKTCISDFQDSNSKMFYFTSNDTELFARKMELIDGVTPSSNSVMSNNLYQLGKITSKKFYIELSEQLVSAVYEEMEQYGTGYSNWGNAVLNFVQPFHEVCITGPNSNEYRKKIAENYIPNSVFIGGKEENLPTLEKRIHVSKTQIFICKNNTCSSPEISPEKAMKQLLYNL